MASTSSGDDGPTRWKLVLLDGAIPCELLLDCFDAGLAKFRMGRSSQPQEFWEQVLPDESVRNTISREHFEIVAAAGDTREEYSPTLWLKNLSSKGTLLNGTVLGADNVKLKHEDVIGLGSVMLESGQFVPAMHFRLVVADGGATREVLLHDSAQRAAQRDWSFTCHTVCGKALASPVQFPWATSDNERICIFKVGRAVQPADFWKSLVPDDALSNCISREHFQMEFEPENDEVFIRNLSTAGTLLNDSILLDRMRVSVRHLLASGSIRIAVPGPGETLPIIDCEMRFPLHGIGASRALASVTTQSTGHSAMASVQAAINAQHDVPPPILTPEMMFLETVPSPSKNIDRDAVVKINFRALPPPFCIECISAVGLTSSELQKMPRECKLVAASCDQACLRVGRSVQPPSFWSTLVPDIALQNMISREHFEISMEGEGHLLKNHSSAGTWVNGEHVQSTTWLQSGDVIRLGTMRDNPNPVLSFQLVQVMDDEFADKSCNN